MVNGRWSMVNSEIETLTLCIARFTISGMAKQENEHVHGENCNHDHHHGHAHAKQQPVRNETPKVGRNEPCPCGSGKKYKVCHGRAG